MKNFILIFSFCALMAVGAAGYFLLADHSVPPQFLDVENKIVVLPKDAKILLHFWGNWCGPCVQELPELDKYAGRHPEIKIYAIHIGRMGQTSPKEIQGLYDQLQIKHLKIYQDPGNALTKHFRVQGFPSTIEIDSNFQELKRLTGPQQWQYYD